MLDVIVTDNEQSILEAIKKLGVPFDKNKDVRFYDVDNLLIIQNFGKFNKEGIKRAKKDRGLIAYKAKTKKAYALVLENVMSK